MTLPFETVEREERPSEIRGSLKFIYENHSILATHKRKLIAEVADCQVVLMEAYGGTKADRHRLHGILDSVTHSDPDQHTGHSMKEYLETVVGPGCEEVVGISLALGLRGTGKYVRYIDMPGSEEAEQYRAIQKEKYDAVQRALETEGTETLIQTIDHYAKSEGLVIRYRDEFVWGQIKQYLVEFSELLEEPDFKMAVIQGSAHTASSHRAQDEGITYERRFIGADISSAETGLKHFYPPGAALWRHYALKPDVPAPRNLLQRDLFIKYVLNRMQQQNEESGK